MKETTGEFGTLLYADFDWTAPALARQSMTLLAVVHTLADTGLDSARVRIISARAATRAERRQYENEPR